MYATIATLIVLAAGFTLATRLASGILRVIFGGVGGILIIAFLLYLLTQWGAITPPIHLWTVNTLLDHLVTWFNAFSHWITQAWDTVYSFFSNPKNPKIQVPHVTLSSVPGVR